MTVVPTLAEVEQWPATISLTQGAAPLGVSESQLRQLAKRGKAPCQVLVIGNRYRVVTASLVRVLKGEPA